MKQAKLLVVSFDAVSSSDLSVLLNFPNFQTLVKTGSLVKNVDSIFISNTYPIHTSMITGVMPKDHGIIDNTYFEYGNKEPYWRWYYDLIKADNIVAQAIKNGLEVATIFWPVMAKAPVKYNIPEIIARDHENQIMAVLKNSTKGFALKYFLKYGRETNGSQQPQLDNFSTKVAVDLLQANKIDLLLLHLTDVDSAKHNYGCQSPQTRLALERMDQRLGKLLKAAGDNYQILVVSDHSQVDAHRHIDLNKNNPFANTWWHLSEGCAVLLEKEPLNRQSFQALKDWLTQQAFFRRFINSQEMHDSGFSQHSRLAIAAQADWAFSSEGNDHRGNHGYPLDLPDYQPFYFVQATGVHVGQSFSGGSILDVAPLILNLLRLPSFPCQGKLRKEIFTDSKS